MSEKLGSSLFPFSSSPSLAQEEGRGEAERGAPPHCDVVSCLSGPRCQRRGLRRGAGRGTRGSRFYRGRGRCRRRRRIVGVVGVVVGNLNISLVRSLLCAPLGAPVPEQ